MDALCNNFAEEDILKKISAKSKLAMSSCQTYINAKTDRKINNTEIVICINELHKSLDIDQEVGIKIDHLGESIIFYIDHIAHQNKSMIYFKGHTESGKLVHFVKHSSDISIELKALKRRSSNELKTPFGFDGWDAYDEAKQLHA